MSADKTFHLALLRSLEFLLDGVKQYCRVMGYLGDAPSQTVRMAQALGNETWTEGPRYTLN